MSQEAEFHETLRKLAMIRQGFIQDKARPALDLTKPSALYPKMTALPGFRAVTSQMQASAASWPMLGIPCVPQGAPALY